MEVRFFIDEETDTAVKRLWLSSAVRPLADYVAYFRDDTVVLTEGNRAVAALIPLKNVDRESLALSQRHVLPKRSPNKRIQPTACKTRRS